MAVTRTASVTFAEHLADDAAKSAPVDDLEGLATTFEELLGDRGHVIDDLLGLTARDALLAERALGGVDRAREPVHAKGLVEPGGALENRDRLFAGHALV